MIVMAYVKINKNGDKNWFIQFYLHFYKQIVQ